MCHNQMYQIFHKQTIRVFSTGEQDVHISLAVERDLH